MAPCAAGLCMWKIPQQLKNVWQIWQKFQVHQELIRLGNNNSFAAVFLWGRHSEVSIGENCIKNNIRSQQQTKHAQKLGRTWSRWRTSVKLPEPMKQNALHMVQHFYWPNMYRPLWNDLCMWLKCGMQLCWWRLINDTWHAVMLVKAYKWYMACSYVSEGL